MNRRYYVNGQRNAIVYKINNNLWANIDAARIMDFPLTQLQLRDMPNGQKLELTPLLGPKSIHVDVVERAEEVFGVAFGGTRRTRAKARLATMKARTPGTPLGNVPTLTGTATVCKYIDPSGTKKPCHGRHVHDATVIARGTRWITILDHGVTVFVRADGFLPDGTATK